MGCTVSELEQRVSLPEFYQWLAYWRLEAEDMRAANEGAQPEETQFDNNGTCPMWEQDEPCNDPACPIHGG